MYFPHEKVVDRPISNSRRHQAEFQKHEELFKGSEMARMLSLSSEEQIWFSLCYVKIEQQYTIEKAHIIYTKNQSFSNSWYYLSYGNQLKFTSVYISFN